MVRDIIFETYYCALNACENGSKKMQMVLRANLSFPTHDTHIKNLIGMRWLEENIEEGERIYRTTEEGKELIKIFHDYLKLIPRKSLGRFVAKVTMELYNPSRKIYDEVNGKKQENIYCILKQCENGSRKKTLIEEMNFGGSTISIYLKDLVEIGWINSTGNRHKTYTTTEKGKEAWNYLDNYLDLIPREFLNTVLPPRLLSCYMDSSAQE